MNVFAALSNLNTLFIDHRNCTLYYLTLLCIWWIFLVLSKFTLVYIN